MALCTIRAPDSGTHLFQIGLGTRGHPIALGRTFFANATIAQREAINIMFT